MTQCAGPLSEVGIRLLLARGWSDRNVPPAIAEAPDTIVSEMRRVYATWHNQAGGRIRVEFGPGAPWACSEETMCRTHQMAQAWGVGTHMHVAETLAELEMDQKRTGMGHIEWLDSMGILGPKTQLVHSVWLSDHEVELIADSGSIVVHCPVSNMYLGSGICKVGRIRKRGIPVALATDGACNNGQGLIDILKVAANLQKAVTLDTSVFSADDILEMACRCGAMAFGEPEALGSLEPGKLADVVMVDMNTLRLGLSKNVVSALVYTAGSADVDTVIVDGQILMQNKRVTVLDEAALLVEAKDAWDGVLRRAGLSA